MFGWLCTRRTQGEGKYMRELSFVLGGFNSEVYNCLAAKAVIFAVYTC